MALRLKSAVIGCGRMGAFTSEATARYAPPCWFPLSHAQAIYAHPDLSLDALCDPNPAALERAANAYPGCRTYVEYRDLIERETPELIGIATRTIGRAAIISSAVGAGVRGLHIEKPLCNSMTELSALSDALSSAEIFCTYGAIRRFFSVFQRARALVQSGQYGRLIEVRVNMGSGMLYWTHPHSVDLILYIAGHRAVEYVQARLTNVVQSESSFQIVSDPIIQSAAIYFADGVVGHIGQGSGFSLIVSCSDAEISVVNDGEGIRIAAPRGDDPYFDSVLDVGVKLARASEGTLAPMAHLVRCLMGDAEERSLNAGLKNQILLGQRILFAMVQSQLEQSKLVRLMDIDPQLVILAKTGEKFA